MRWSAVLRAAVGLLGATQMSAAAAATALVDGVPASATVDVGEVMQYELVLPKGVESIIRVSHHNCRSCCLTLPKNKKLYPTTSTLRRRVSNPRSSSLFKATCIASCGEVSKLCFALASAGAERSTFFNGLSAHTCPRSPPAGGTDALIRRPGPLCHSQRHRAQSGRARVRQHAVVDRQRAGKRGAVGALPSLHWLLRAGGDALSQSRLT
jgi:hypothetical protein